VYFDVALASGNKFAICNGKKRCAGPWREKLSNVAIGTDGHAYISVTYTGHGNDNDTILFKANEGDSSILAEVAISGAGGCSWLPPQEKEVACIGWCPIWEDPRSWLINPMVLWSLAVLPVLAWAMGRNFGAAYQTNKARMIVAATGFAVIAVGGSIGAWIVVGATALAGGAAVLRQTTIGQR
jgi:hypothetical protein